MYETKNQYLSLINSLIYELLKQLRIVIETEKNNHMNPLFYKYNTYKIWPRVIERLSHLTIK